MEPVTVIVSALAAGAVTASKDVTEQAIKEAYQGFKNLIRQRYKGFLVDAVESDPKSEDSRQFVEKELAKAGAENDEELLDRAKALLDTVKAYEPQAAATIGVDLEKIEAEYLKIKKIAAAGPSGATGVKVREGKLGLSQNSDCKVRYAVAWPPCSQTMVYEMHP